jgi:hypothetical protein
LGILDCGFWGIREMAGCGGGLGRCGGRFR